ncbi:MAG TPA: hypothetical protein VFH39_00970 [Candidatus Saccharimonadales bacterium]|jgi:hypothetical protein|nr:hypothetical protein [Candidatus Saccharimonadales bacterium]
MIARIAAAFINFFLALTEIFLGVRFLLRFFAANPANSFVHWVYNSSDILLQPFRGMFGTTVVGNNHVVEFNTLFAMAIYAVAALILLWLVSFFDPVRYRTAVVRK